MTKISKPQKMQSPREPVGGIIDQPILRSFGK